MLRRLSACIVTFALALTYFGGPAVAAVPFDSGYAGESAFIDILPGQTGGFQVFFRNTGTSTWAKGTATQVDLATCREDKVTCNAQDPADAAWNSGWLSEARYAAQTQSSVAPGQIGTFAYSVRAPFGSSGTTRFNGDLVVSITGARIHPEGYYQDATVIQPPPPPPPAQTAPPATPAPTPTPPQLTCFDGTTDTANGQTGGAIYGGVCTRTSNTSATLNNVPPGRDGEYSGVYFDPDVLKGRALSAITNLSFSFTGSALEANGPRISLPINDGESPTFYAFIDALYCNDGAGNVNVLTDATCTIFWTGGPVSGVANWAAFVEAMGSNHVANATTFIIADGPGAWTLSNIALR